MLEDTSDGPIFAGYRDVPSHGRFPGIASGLRPLVIAMVLLTGCVGDAKDAADANANANANDNDNDANEQDCLSGPACASGNRSIMATEILASGEVVEPARASFQLASIRAISTSAGYVVTWLATVSDEAWFVMLDQNLTVTAQDRWPAALKGHSPGSEALVIAELLGQNVPLAARARHHGSSASRYVWNKNPKDLSLM